VVAGGAAGFGGLTTGFDGVGCVGLALGAGGGAAIIGAVVLALTPELSALALSAGAGRTRGSRSAVERTVSDRLARGGAARVGSDAGGADAAL
jgi:hypothetical protein